MNPADFAARMASFGPAPARVAVAVSGGPHSLALAWLARGWAREAGIELVALIAEHGLRAESAAEALGVRAMIEGAGIAARILPLDLAAGPAMQERAREARLSALLAECHAADARWLLLGHHRMDQAETVLLRAARGSGPSGLAGMPAMRRTAEAWLLRPLLDVTPAALEAVCATAGLAPVRDPSNDDERFARIRVRLSLADPGGTGPRVAALAAAADAFGRRRVAVEEAMLARLPAVTLRMDGTARIDRPALGRDAVAQLLLGRMLRAVGGNRHAPAHADVAALLHAGQGTLGGAWWHRDGWLVREPALVPPPVAAVAGAWWDGRFHLANAWPGCRLGALGSGGPRRAALPALWRGDECIATPHVGVGKPVPGLTFRPIGGPVDAVFHLLPQMSHSPGANVTYVM